MDEDNYKHALAEKKKRVRGTIPLAILDLFVTSKLTVIHDYKCVTAYIQKYSTND